MQKQTYSPDEIVQRGEALYEQKIRGQVETENRGKFLVLDIETGDFAIDQDDLTASERVLARNPNAVLYGLRIGHSVAYRVGHSQDPRS